MNSPEDDSRTLFERIAVVIARVPAGRVVTYGQVAAMAGNPRAARQVVRVLNAWSSKRDLPWFRVVNRDGKISLPRGGGFEEQRALLVADGVAVDDTGRIDMTRYRWDGDV
jgi:methylated-DNA-protein-cysteine methyltransferase-like protein